MRLRFLVSGGMGNEVAVWRTDIWRNLRTLKHSQEFPIGSLVRSVAFNPDGNYSVGGMRTTVTRGKGYHIHLGALG